MKKLRITITVGTGLRKDGLPISGAALCCMCSRAEKFFLATCGGYTNVGGSSTGGWREVSKSQQITDWRETCLVYVLLVDPGAVAVKPLAEWVRDNFEQKSVVLVTETVDCEVI